MSIIIDVFDIEWTNMQMPPDAVIVAILGLIGTVVAPIIAYRNAVEKTKRDFNDKALQNRYYLVYCPLRKLIMNTHLASCRMGFPFSYRFAEAIELIKKRKFKKAFVKIKNKYEKSVTHEVEYGGDFPFDKIQKIVGNNIRWADSKLVRLIEAADRASYENWEEEDAGFLCHEKFELTIYIFDTYEKLSKRLLPKT